jgi:hypothetical protein
MFRRKLQLLYSKLKNKPGEFAASILILAASFLNLFFKPKDGGNTFPEMAGKFSTLQGVISSMILFFVVTVATASNFKILNHKLTVWIRAIRAVLCSVWNKVRVV